MEAKHILGAVTIIAIVGGTIYFVKKAKDKKNTVVEEKPMTAEEAKELVESMNKLRSTIETRELVDDLRHSPESLAERYGHRQRVAEFTVGPMNINGVSTSFVAEAIYDPEQDEDSTVLDDEDYEIIEGPRINDGVVFDEDELEQPLAENMTEEDMVLRHEPSSREARSQFIKMELAEWLPLEDVYQTMLNLFEFPFNPMNDGDWDLKTRIIDHRVQFFGFGSRWAQEVSYADVILHYARSAAFNCDETVKYWVEYFLDFNEFDVGTSSHKIDYLLERLNTHTYFNEERQTFGLFGLTRNSMDQAIKIANMNVDRSVTYQIEFNEFLKSCL